MIDKVQCSRYKGLAVDFEIMLPYFCIKYCVVTPNDNFQWDSPDRSLREVRATQHMFSLKKKKKKKI